MNHAPEVATTTQTHHLYAAYLGLELPHLTEFNAKLANLETLLVFAGLVSDSSRRSDVVPWNVLKFFLVRRVTFGSPLEILLLITGGSTAGLAIASRAVNLFQRAQEARRSFVDTQLKVKEQELHMAVVDLLKEEIANASLQKEAVEAVVLGAAAALLDLDVVEVRTEDGDKKKRGQKDT